MIGKLKAIQKEYPLLIVVLQIAPHPMLIIVVVVVVITAVQVN